VGLEGQERLSSASVFIAGAGGLGSPAALYLAAAGVGRIGIADFDTVELSNLQRQILHGTVDLGRPKVDSAVESVRRVNPLVSVEPHRVRLTAKNVMELIATYDVVIDATDNFPTRYLLNDACVFSGKPLVYGSIFRFTGQVSVFDAKQGPCYRCFFAEPPPAELVPSCEESGVLGVLPGVIGSLQATEALKLILSKGRALIGRLLLYDGLNMGFREVRVKKNPNCPVCGEHPTQRGFIDYEFFCGHSKSADETNGNAWISPTALRELIDSGRSFFLIDVRNPSDYAINRIPGAKSIPLSELESGTRQIGRDQDVVVYCHFGGRSGQAAEWLKHNGFKKVLNLKGGIDAWSRQIDTTCPRY